MSKSVEAARTRAFSAPAPGVAALTYRVAEVRLAWRNMWRNWRRTVIAVVAIVLGLVLLLFMDGLIAGSDQAIFGNAVRLYGGNIQIHAVGFRDKATRLPLLPLENADAVVQTARAQPEVTFASKRINTGGMISSRDSNYAVSITAVEPAFEAPHSLQAENITEGRYLLPDDGDAIVIGRGMAEALGVGLGDRVTLLGKGFHETMRQRTMTIVGIYDLGLADAEKLSVFITLGEAQSLYGLSGQSTEVTIGLQKVGQEEQVVAALQRAFPELEVDSWETLRPEMRQTMDTKSSVSSFFSFIVLFIAAIGILNLMLMAVFERTREMGILAAVGMRGRQIMTLFLWEGTLIGVVGAIVGCALGALALAVMNGLGGLDLSFTSGMGELSALMGTHIFPSLSPTRILNRGIAVAIIAALAALYPAWQAAHQEPAQALHHH